MGTSRVTESSPSVRSPSVNFRAVFNTDCPYSVNLTLRMDNIEKLYQHYETLNEAKDQISQVSNQSNWESIFALQMLRITLILKIVYFSLIVQHVFFWRGRLFNLITRKEPPLLPPASKKVEQF